MYICKDENPVWDQDKQRLIREKEDSFYICECHKGDKLPGIWYKAIEKNADSSDEVIGFGWIDVDDSLPEISIVVDDKNSHNGIGRQLTDELCNECKKNGASKVRIVIRSENIYYKRVVKIALNNGFYWDNDSNAGHEMLCKLLERGFNVTMEKDL